MEEQLKKQPTQTTLPQTAQPVEEDATLQAVLEELELTPEQAEGILRQTVERVKQQRALANRVLEAIDSIGDPAFTLKTLRDNEKALRELENGVPVGTIYRRYFVKAAMPRMEKDANLGAEGVSGMALSRGDIERISEYVDRTGKVYTL